MEQWELIICFTDGTWTTDFVDVVQAHIDGPNDITQGYVDDYNKNMTEDSKDISFVGVYHVVDLEDEVIGWQPTQLEYPVSGLASFEVYENLEMGKGCHPEVKKWVAILDGDIEDVIIIPHDGEN